jgi:hypothetical protein
MLHDTEQGLEKPSDLSNLLYLPSNGYLSRTTMKPSLIFLMALLGIAIAVPVHLSDLDPIFRLAVWTTGDSP